MEEHTASVTAAKVTVCTLCRGKECLRTGRPCLEVEMRLPKPERARMGRAEQLRPGLKMVARMPLPHRYRDMKRRLSESLGCVPRMLTKEQWDVVLNVWLYGRSHAETARMLGISKRASRERLKRVLRYAHGQLDRIRFCGSLWWSGKSDERYSEPEDAENGWWS